MNIKREEERKERWGSRKLTNQSRREGRMGSRKLTNQRRKREGRMGEIRN